MSRINQASATKNQRKLAAESAATSLNLALAKRELARQISEIIAERGLTQAQAADLLSVDQPKISAIKCGRLGGFSIDRLLRFLNVLGRDVEISAKPAALAGNGRVSVVAGRGLSLDDLRAHRTEILRIASAHGARNVRVFGSVARGEARAESDVDFLVDLEPGHTALDVGELMLDLSEALGREVDVLEIRRPSPVARQIEREAVPL